MSHSARTVHSRDQTCRGRAARGPDLDPSAAENSRRHRKFYGRRKSAAKYCGWLWPAVNLLFGGRRIFLAKFGGGSVGA